ncbi:MAG: pantoate--beta-alanine ligase [Desulfonatronovibrio sp.]
MEIISNPAQMQGKALEVRKAGINSGLVPTMGYFHQGHLSLMEWARENCGLVIVSLFVNPAQFGPGEDLGKYPRNLERDIEMAESKGVDFLFTPASADLYPQGYDTWIEVPALSRELCGRSRPGHFRGVATIVCRLFNLTLPHTAVFGEKDRQQLMVIKRMVRDLNIPIVIKGIPTVREDDGLAMSSRNAYLTPEERRVAPNIYRGMVMARDMVHSGTTEVEVLKQNLKDYYQTNIPGMKIDYIEIVDSETLQFPGKAGPGTFLTVALKLGQTRLIDNLDFDRAV